MGVTLVVLLPKRWGLSLLLFLLIGLVPAQAQREASKPLVPKFLSRMLTPLPSGKEAYLVVTAGGASTDVLVIAPPSTPPPRLVQALQSSVAATPLRSQPIEWSAPTDRIPWTAAHAALRAGRIGTWQASNAVPIGALCDGLRRGGFEPHPSLHLPVSTDCVPLPAPFADFRGDRWYDLSQMRPRDFLQVTDSFAPADLLPLLLPIILIPVVGLASLTAAVRWARQRDPARAGRKRFEGISAGPVMVCFIGWLIWTMFSFTSLTQLHAINDLWFGRAGNGDLFPAWFLLILMAVSSAVWNGQRVEMRLYGPKGAVPVAVMSAQERALHEREALWMASLLPLMFVVGVVLLAGGFAWLPARFAPALVRLIPVLLLIPVSLYFTRKRKAFTTLAPDAVLTDTLRTVVSAPGLPPGEVSIEQSARAKAFAFLENGRDGQVVVSQKLTEIATPDQMRFLVAAQSVLGRTRDWSTPLTLLTAVALLGGIVGVSQLAPLHYFALSMSLMLLLMVVMIATILFTARLSERRMINADREALGLTDNGQAALEALELVRQNTAPPSGSRGGQSQAALRITKRIAAIKKRAAEDA